MWWFLRGAARFHDLLEEGATINSSNKAIEHIYRGVIKKYMEEKVPRFCQFSVGGIQIFPAKIEKPLPPELIFSEWTLIVYIC